MLYVYFHYAAYKVRVMHVKMSLTLNTRGEAPHKRIIRVTFTHYVRAYVLCNLHSNDVYPVVYIRARRYVCASHDIRMYYKFGTSTRDCKIRVQLCTQCCLRTARINFNKLEFPCLKMNF